MIIHIPLYKRNKYLRSGGKYADCIGTEHYNDGWLYLRFETDFWKPWRAGGRDSQERTRVYYKGWTFDFAVGLSIGKTKYSVIHNDY